MINEEAEKDEKVQKEVFVDTKTQDELNKPLAADHVVSEEEMIFLELVMELVKKGTIDLYRPATLVNYKVYDELSEERRGRTDLEAMNLLSVIRQIKDLYDNGFKNSYQMENLVQRLRVTKERLEEKDDLFII